MYISAHPEDYPVVGPTWDLLTTARLFCYTAKLRGLKGGRSYKECRQVEGRSCKGEVRDDFCDLLVEFYHRSISTKDSTHTHSL